MVAREEERRRLRADLHDGVAPALAGTALQLESLARRLEREGQPALAAAGPRAARRAARRRSADLRALVHGLRPPVLDQRGLEGALRQLVVGHEMPALHRADRRPRRAARGDRGGGVRDRGARRSATRCGTAVASRVELDRASRPTVSIVVAVSDNGIGMPGPAARRASGMISMRERAAEVGGRLEVEPTPGGGTTIRATLPLEIP